jgi:hypothetical protein
MDASNPGTAWFFRNKATPRASDPAGPLQEVRLKNKFSALPATRAHFTCKIPPKSPLLETKNFQNELFSR